VNNYNNIFAVIKKYCSSASDEPCLEKVIAHVQITKGMNTHYEYLDVMQELGFIEYSIEKKTITLTDKGKRAQKLFT
jgi:predicted transcriptional regulator